MSITTDNNNLLIELYDGDIFNETKEENYILKTKFEQYNLSLDLTSFKMERTTLDRFSNRAKTMNIKELNHSIDSLQKERC